MKTLQEILNQWSIIFPTGAERREKYFFQAFGFRQTSPPGDHTPCG
jgi:hypothetical protein